MPAAATYALPVRADLLIRGARVVDQDRLEAVLGVRAEPPVVDVGITDGVVVGLRPTDHRQAAAERVLEADGRWLMPGLWDHHVHPTDWASVGHRLDLRSATSTADCIAAVAARLQERPGEEVVAAALWCAGWSARPTRADLDRFATPVTLLSGDSHSAVLNGAALARYGLQQTADDDGWVAESAWFAVMPRIGSAEEATRDRWVVEAGRRAAARGVVGIVDLDPHDTHEAWRRRVAAGFAAHRVRAGVWIEHLDAAIAAGLRTGDPVPGAGPLVSMGPLKVIADGSLNTRTAHCRHPFSGGGHGAMNIAQPTLVAAMRRAREAGIEAAIHAIGDAALALVLEAFEASGARGTVEHVQLTSPEDIARMAALGIAASVQPWHLVGDRDLAVQLWGERTARAYAYADLRHAGIELRLGSDAPVAPLDPWHAIAAAVRRTGDARPAWHPEQCLDLATALRASWRSRLAVGAPADLVLLEEHPADVAPPLLADTAVAATLCAGNVTHLTF